MSGSPGRVGCVVISHAYLEPEVAKSIDALAAHLSVRLVTPRRSPVLVFDDRRSESLAGRPFEVVGLRRLPRQGVLFLFASFRLGLECKPDHILVEYDPWAPIFWQVLLARSIYCPRSRLYVVAKKNTFRRHPRWVAAVKSRLARAGLRRVSGVLAASRKVATLYRDEFGVADSSIDVVPMHPVDASHFRPSSADRRGGRVRIGFVGRLDRQKGVDVLLDAIESLIAGGAAVELHAVGPMGDVGELNRPGAPDGTYVWHRPVPNSEVAALLQQLDIFVMPSARLPDHEEHDGRALLEAMATEIACVGSNSGIIPELLGDGRGRIFPAGDAAALVRELSVLINHPDERTRLGKEARAFVEQTASTQAAAAVRASVLCSSHRDREVTYSARDSYKRSDVVAEYETRRFAGAMGRRRWVAEQEALSRVFDRLPGSSTILDCPVGNGRWAEQLLRRGHRVTGVDVSEAMLDAAGERMERIAAEGGEPARLLLGDAEDLQFSSGSYDVVFSHALTKHLPPDVQDRVFAEFARVSRRAVVCSFSVLSGPTGALWRLRRLPEAYGRRPGEIAELAASHGLRIEFAAPCTTGLGVERTMLFVRG